MPAPAIPAAVWAVGAAIAFLSSACASNPPPPPKQPDPEPNPRNREEEIAFQAMKRLKEMGATPDLDRGCPRYRYGQDFISIDYVGRNDGQIQTCETLGYIAEKPHLFPELSRKLNYGERIEWDLGEKHPLVREFVGRMKLEMEANGFDWKDPEVRGKVARVLHNLAMREIKVPLGKAGVIPYLAAEKLYLNEFLQQFYDEFQIKQLPVLLEGKTTLLNLSKEESVRFNQGSSFPFFNFLTFALLNEAGFQLKFLLDNPLPVPTDSDINKVKFSLFHGTDVEWGGLSFNYPFRFGHGLFSLEAIKEKKTTPIEPIQYLAKSLAWNAYNIWDHYVDGGLIEEFNSALNMFNSALNMDPFSLEVSLLAGDAMEEFKKDFSLADFYYQRAIQLYPNNPNVYLWVVNSQVESFLKEWRSTNSVPDREESQFEQAIAFCKKAIKLDPKNRLAYLLLGLVRSGKRYVAANNSLLGMLSLDIDEVLAENLLPFQKAVDLGIEDPLPYLFVGTYLLRKDPEDPEGLKLFLKGYKSKPSPYEPPVYIPLLESLPEKARLKIEK